MPNKFPLILSFLILISCNEKQKSSNFYPNDKKVIKAVANQNTKELDKKTLKLEKKELVNCMNVVMEILTTSPTYLKTTNGLTEAVIKNGGTSFGILIEGSPNPKANNAMEYSETYDFNIHESYEDREPVVARFSFDPIKKQLYLYNAAEDTLVPIAFDKKLLLKLNKVCQ
ncbi:hypothetical protein CLU81_0546 [Flavobacterium sp. 9]|uniref:hypothetical protein n=1 Tax=Flavobacterium sp. 9 TaxID=2035198 RepID=UPI000C177B95|nr:hypothetical protein [Flavobacterium sp. 9]PIF30142.1 hypothetical protein CLU81_0546 [Flavobacterium sp. 9]